MAFWLTPGIAKADTPIPTSVVSSYDAVLHKLTLTINWAWGSTANTKIPAAAVFADLNGDGIVPTYLDNPATYNSGGNAFPAGLTARDEFLGQLAISTIEGSAISGIYTDHTDNGVAATIANFGVTHPRVLFPYGTTTVNNIGLTGSFTMTFTNLNVTPTKICVVMYDVHTDKMTNLSGKHSARSANPDHNGDNSVEDGNSMGTVSCTGLVSLSCAINKTETPCQSQAAINASYAAWLASVTASGCNGTLTNNSTGAPSASGGSKTVTFTYTQSTCSNQASVTTCTATFTVPSCNGCNARVTSLYFNELNGGPDLPIPNGSTFTLAQLGSLYNLEAGTVGTIGSVKYTITGPTPSTNIENSTPYNSPSTGSGAWTGAVGNYNVNLKTYTGADGTGTLCHDTTISFTVTNNNNCDCVGSNVVLNPSFENGTTNWSSAGGSLAAGNGGVACGSFSGDLNNTSSTSKAWQVIGTDLAIGTLINAKVYAGTHDNTFNNWVAIEFLDAGNVVLGSSVYVQVDKVLANAPAGPQLYTFSATVPAGAKYTRVAFGGNGSYTKTDFWCVNLTPSNNCPLGGVNLGSLSNYLFVFTNGSVDANWQSASKGFVGNVAVDGIQASERTSGSFAYAGTIFSNDASLNAWSSIVTNNASQASSSLNQTARLTSLENDLNNVFTQINALPVTAGFNGVSALSLNGLNKQNSIAETIVINVTSDFTISSQINITGDANDLFILRWDTDMNFGNGYQGQVKFQSGGAIVPKGGLDPSNFLHVAGDIGSSGGGSTPPAPYPQGPRFNNGTGALITGGADFSGGGFFTGYWYTTGNPANNETSSLSNAIFVGGWYSKTTKFSMTSGTSGVYVEPQSCALLTLGNRVWYDTDNDGINDAAENGIANVTVNLYADNNNDNIADGAAIATVQTNSSGNYSFNNLSAGNYIVGVVKPNGYMSSSVNGGDPDNNTDLDDNGQVVSGNEVRGLSITLTQGSEPNGNTNNTYDFGFLPDCACTNSAGNLLVNASFENGTTGWTWSGGTLTTGTGYIACGAKNGFNNWSAGTSKVWQDVTVPAGVVVTFTGFAGTHTPGITCSPKLSLIFLNAAGTVLSQSDVIVTRDVDINNGQLEQYSIVATAPAGTAKVRVQSAINCNTMKIDAFCLTYVQNYASLGDYVWRDDNTNGIQDSGEPGVSGVTVTLFDNTGRIVGSTITDAYGKYLFTKLMPGNYSAAFTLPANYTFTSSTGTSETNATNSDVDPVTGRTTTITLDPAEDQRNIDAGIIFNNQGVRARIGDRVWLDLNRDGIQDANEPGVSGVTVTLYDISGNIVSSQVTDKNGYYQFADDGSGTGFQAGNAYTIGFSAPPGTVISPRNAGNVDVDSDPDPLTGRTSSFTIPAGTVNLTFDCGLFPQDNTKASLGDYAWKDLNRNGIQEAGEPGFPGITVNLYAADGVTILRTTTTDAYGYYIFTNLDPGSYKVGFVKPASLTISPKDAAADNIDSDPDQISGITGFIVLNGGDRNMTVDAGIYLTNAPGLFNIGDRVWNDENRDGVQNAGEEGISGVTVTLFRNGADGLPGTADDVFMSTMSTDKNGNYLFTDLAASTGSTSYYNVQFSNIPAGYRFTTQKQTANGGNSTNDSDPGVVSGRTGSINLTGDDLTIDAGLVQGTFAGKGSIGDRVWYDLPGGTAGVQDAGETGVAGVTVKLYRDANFDGVISGAETTAIATTTTDNLGNYMFGGLDAGNYQVGFSALPAGFTLASQDLGGDDTRDSDGFPLGTAVNGNTATAGTSYTSIITLAPGEDNLTRDLGIVPPANTNTLGDYVWFDQNTDGLQTAGEPGVKGVMVTLYNSGGIAQGVTVTDNNGKYLFTGLADGTYSVGFSNLPAGFSFTTQSATNTANGSDANATTGLTGTVALGAANRTDLSLDAGLTSTRAALGDYVWFDVNSDGIQDASETGISGSTVTITRPGFGLDGIAGNADDALPVGTTITDASGRYYFGNLVAGSYVANFGTLPGSLVFTKQNTPGDNQNNTNSDANPATGNTASIALSAGESDMTVDAGVSPALPGSVGDYVWHDINRNGVQDATEVGIAGVVVTLYNSSNAAVGSAVTDGNGKYLITNIPAGTGYYVNFSNLPTWGIYTTQTSNVTPTDATLGSDPDPANGNTAAFPVVAGELNPSIDCGIRGFNLSGNVWHDVNGMNDNLVNNTGPLMVPPAAPIPTGLRITLVDASTGIVLRSTLVAGNGTYSFSNVLPGSYTLVLSPLPGTPGQPSPFASLPSGWINTGEKLGLTPGRDAVINGKLTVGLVNADVINANFGIQLNNDDIGIN